jgi:LPXTG-site transpeptidase (sortase) family protein
VLLIIYGTWGLIRDWKATHGQFKPSPVAHSNRAPSEQPVGLPYNVPPNQPKQISLPTIDTTGYIQQVGTIAGGVGTPDSIFMAGWYNQTVKPGAAGLSIIDGHVQGAYKPGVFKNLINLKSGDTFTVTFGDNSVRTFKVLRLQSYSVTDAAPALFARDTSIKAQLNLITCTGKYDTVNKQFNQRLVVVSERI